MRGRWVFTSPLLLLAAMVAPALPLGALVLLGCLTVTVLALVVANSVAGRHLRREPPPCRSDDDA